jgi:hypothetical protein
MSGLLFVTVHSPSRDSAREKNFGFSIFPKGAKFGFRNSGIGVDIDAFRPFMN